MRSADCTDYTEFNNAGILSLKTVIVPVAGFLPDQRMLLPSLSHLLPVIFITCLSCQIQVHPVFIFARLTTGALLDAGG